MPYCFTCHSVQGLSINDPITLFDTNIAYSDRNWIYTAITRATDFRNITIFEHDYEEVKRLEYCKMKQYFELKIQGYKEQDKKCNREYNKDEYINYKWIENKMLEQLDKCILCDMLFETYLNKQNNVISNLTVDRIDNNAAHI